MSREAAFYETTHDKTVRCLLCPHHCLLTDGKCGLCLTRTNRGGRLISENYCRPVSTAIDPIEKKPLYHFLPGARIFSSGPNGCNLKCTFCQNCEISQELLPTREVSPEGFAGAIIRSGTAGVAYTYSEPYIWYETIMEIGARVRDAGLVNVMVTNGYMEPAPLEQLLSVVDAMNIDIKSMSPGFYRRLCKAELAHVLRTCETVKKNCHLEITNLLITGENDAEEDVRQLVDYIAANLGRDTPLHISRYFPRHRFTKPPTPTETLDRAWAIATDKLDYVYLGNVGTPDRGNTRCPECGELLVERQGYAIRVTANLKPSLGGRSTCTKCGAGVNIRLG